MVHETYGIGRYTGIETLTTAGVTRDYIGIQYAGTDKLFIPVEKLDMAYDFVVKHRLLEKNLFYNINIPADPTGIRITRQGGPYYSDHFTLENGMVTPHGIDVFTPCGQEDVDTDCVLRYGMISITPMTNQRANMPLYQELRELNG